MTNGGAPTTKEFTFRAPPTAFEALRAAGSTSRPWRTTTAWTTASPGSATRSQPRSGTACRSSASVATTRRPTVRSAARSTARGSPSSARRRFWTTSSSRRGPQVRASPGSHRPRTFRGSCAPYERARATSDTVVVFLHWGVELQQCPSPDQRALARQLVAAGADVVVGGHAHRVQGAGRMGHALVGYGLGNFVWYGTSELSTQTGVLVVTVDGRARPRVPVGARPDRRRGAASADGFGSLTRGRDLALAARLHGPEAVGAGLHFPAAGR